MDEELERQRHEQLTPNPRHVQNEQAFDLDTAPPSAGEETHSLITALLNDAVSARATDIHIDPHGTGYCVRFRIDGDLHDTLIITASKGTSLINQLKARAGLDPVHLFKPEEARCEYSMDGQTISLRITAVSAAAGEKLAIRLLNANRVEHHLDELGIESRRLEQLYDWLKNMSGMFLVTGPTGSGKTTTLYALLHELRRRNSNVVTIEDPVEYLLPGITQLPVNTRRGMTFSSGLKAMLRLDPDYLLLGEIRDRESAETAIDAASSGRVLLSSMHCRDATDAVTTLQNWDIEPHEIRSTLAVVVAQRLVRSLCPECRATRRPSESDEQLFSMFGAETPEKVWYAVGCAACQGLGYRGRTGVFEVWHLTEADTEPIMQQADARTLRQRLRERGHRFLLDDALDKVRHGITSIAEVRHMGGFGPGGNNLAMNDC